MVMKRSTGGAARGRPPFEPWPVLSSRLVAGFAYRGTAPAMNDLVGGHVDFLCEQSVSVAEQIKAGTVRGYVVSANQRLAALPDIPSAKEATINFQMSIWAGIFTPKGTPKEIVTKLSSALDKALDDPAVKDVFPTSADRFRPSRKGRRQVSVAWLRPKSHAGPPS
jgi:Tripartite tricarboxylate transporter family receptor